MKEDLKGLLRKLPAVDQLLGRPEVEQLLTAHPRNVVVEKIRSVIEEARSLLVEQISQEVSQQLAESWWEQNLTTSYLIQKIRIAVEEVGRRSLRPVINATGVVLHTNLGRAVLSQAAQQAVLDTAQGYSNLELDLLSGERGSRYAHVESLLKRLTGAEAALVVNNNAAAVLLALSVMAAGREVIVSRGQLVEIGGAFRVPEVMLQSGCQLKEVGTTNKTHLRDYAQAVTEHTGLFLKVHTSNYRVIGFTQEVGLSELVELSNQQGIPILEDIGSGFLIDLRQYGIGDEPTVQNSIEHGVDVVTFSGDKLLGGPQAGIIVGRKQYIDAMKKHPLTRALRIDKLTLAALEATLKVYLDEQKTIATIPTLKMLTSSLEELVDQAHQLAQKIKANLPSGSEVTLADDNSQVGGGAMPLTLLPTKVVKIRPGAGSVQNWANLLRVGEPAVVVRVQENYLILDPRTILPGEEEQLVTAFRQITTKESEA